MDRTEYQTDPAHSAPPEAFARTLSRGIRTRRLTLKEVRDQLAARGVQVSAVTLSYWMRGRTQPERPESLRAVSILEDLLRVTDEHADECASAAQGARAQDACPCRGGLR